MSKRDRQKKALRKKPITELSPKEFQETFDDIESPIDDAMLLEARTNSSNSLEIAAAILRSPDGRESILHHVCEYGDGDGLEQVSDTVQRMRRGKKLAPGETVDRVVFKFDLQAAVERRAEPVPLPTLAERIADLASTRH